MPKFTLEHNSKKAAAETYETIKNFLSTGNEIKKFDANAKCSFDDSKMCASISGAQFKAEMKVRGSGPESQIHITVDLPFLLMPFKGKVQETLLKMLNKHLV